MEQWPSLTVKEGSVTPKNNGTEMNRKAPGSMSLRVPNIQAKGPVAQRKLDLPTEGVKPKWAILFDGNQLSARGMNLAMLLQP